MASVVTGVPISDLGVATPLAGDELVPVVQGGTTKQTTTQDIADLGGGGAATVVTGSGGVDSTLTAPDTYDVKLSDMPDATVKGRATGAGLGPPDDLTETDLGDLVWEDFSNDLTRRIANDVGYLTVPGQGSSNRALTQDDCGTCITKTTASSSTLILPSQANDPDVQNGFVCTFICTNAGGALAIQPDAGVTLLDLSDGTTGLKTISGIGVATVRKLQPNAYTIHGVNLVA